MDTGGRVWARTTMHLRGFPIGVTRLVDPDDLDIQAFFENKVLVRTDEHGVDLAAAPDGPSAEPDTEPETEPEPEPEPPQELHEPGPEPDATPGAGLHDEEDPDEGEAAAA